MTTSAIDLGGEDGQESIAPNIRRFHLRSRLEELDALIAQLTAERQRLLAESNAIVYPITTEIFLRCLPCDSNPRPSSGEAPLLLGQICRQWREIALDTPALWRCLLLEMPVELLHIWLSRSGNLPLSLHCQDSHETGALLEASLAHSHHLQDVKITLPLTSIAKLNLCHTSLPMLRSISIDISHWDDESAMEAVILRDVPFLREAHVYAPRQLNIEMPWRQLVTLTLRHDIEFMKCLSLLRGCPDLVNLTVHTLGPATAHTDLLPLHSLESLSCNFGTASLLDFLTVPRLARLTVREVSVPQDAAVLEAFIRRSACLLRFFSYYSADMTVDTALPCLRAVPDSVSELELISRSGPSGFSEQFFTALQSMDLLPQLKTLHLRGGRQFHKIYEPLLDMLRFRMQQPPPRVALKSLTLHLMLYSARYKPSHSTVVQFGALASAGLKIKFTIWGRDIASPTHTLLDTSTG
ncbi:hypothetical protein B0H19DRAFT_1187243 [Mycena capillaripes]|nr:hypothetical protein B0H19DRAFT_1186755 [Mycena capillaripes]KAJ6533216.1 hypothetical protein B0H19DRAFT_1187243 [Mycena capillaripes]